MHSLLPISFDSLRDSTSIRVAQRNWCSQLDVDSVVKNRLPSYLEGLHQCCICQCWPVNPIKTPCDHFFCDRCLATSHTTQCRVMKDIEFGFYKGGTFAEMVGPMLLVSCAQCRATYDPLYCEVFDSMPLQTKAIYRETQLKCGQYMAVPVPIDDKMQDVIVECEFVGNAKQLEKHQLHDCLMRQLACCYHGCSFMGNLGAVTVHMLNCDKRPRAGEPRPQTPFFYAEFNEELAHFIIQEQALYPMQAHPPSHLELAVIYDKDRIEFDEAEQQLEVKKWQDYSKGLQVITQEAFNDLLRPYIKSTPLPQATCSVDPNDPMKLRIRVPAAELAAPASLSLSSAAEGQQQTAGVQVADGDAEIDPTSDEQQAAEEQEGDGVLAGEDVALLDSDEDALTIDSDDDDVIIIDPYDDDDDDDVVMLD